MTLDEILLEAEEKMTKTEQFVLREFAGVRTGKASAALVENIMVEAYGGQMRIRELAGITTPEPRVLIIQPWDASLVHAIEKAIQKANLGITPSIQGKTVRLFFPELSQERRQEFVRIVRKMAEDARVAIGLRADGAERNRTDPPGARTRSPLPGRASLASHRAHSRGGGGHHRADRRRASAGGF